jgi:3-phosphoshikimate 1-carboxyvinyltransferase
MPLPVLIEIVPLNRPLSAVVSVPGSKSITNRALILAALGSGETTITGALWSEDTQLMVAGLRQLGFEVEVAPDAEDAYNRTIIVGGENGIIPRAGTEAEPLEIFVGNAGTAARFLAALVCLGRGYYRLQGAPRMHERPQQELFKALGQLGYALMSTDGRLPVVIQGGGPRAGQCEVSVIESSQFATALLLCADVGNWRVHVRCENEDELPYVSMTEHMIRNFPRGGGVFHVEPDASSGSYFWAASWLLSSVRRTVPVSTRTGATVQRVVPFKSDVVVRNWPHSGWQVDAAFLRYLPLPATISRARDLGDSIMTAMMLAPFGSQTVCFTDLRRLRVQECERVAAVCAELLRCGAQVQEQGDALSISPSKLHGAEVETYQDHRMAMCFALLGLRVPGIRIKNPACVRKTFPNYFQKLAAPPPGGLGVDIRAPDTGRVLKLPELLAD